MSLRAAALFTALGFAWLADTTGDGGASLVAVGLLIYALAGRRGDES